MRRFIPPLLLVFLVSFAGVFAAPTVCLNMIVKNETDVIERCLQSVLPIIDYWVIVDTGSTDGTQQMIQAFMDKHGVKGELHERPWKNFSHNRNEALQLAKGKSDYIFFIDADEYLMYEPNFKLPHLDKDFYYITVLHSGSSYPKLQFAKSSLNWKWEGVLHEYLGCPGSKTFATLEGVSNVYTTEGARSKDPLKYKKDAAVLEDALKDDPSNCRYVFYLAQSYRDAREYDNALKSYHKRVSMGGWDQEVFYSMLQIASIKEILNYPKEDVLESYFQAFSNRPSRAEPLYRIANYYRRLGDFKRGYQIASIAAGIEKPNDILFVEDWIYNYGADLELSVCAYWIDEFEKSRDVSLKLLDREDLPGNVRDCVKKNLEFANVKLAELSMR
ncbi:glycosyltransferase [Waddlia chondrophila]|uniref:Glycosyl transferase, group 2 family protein n=1 Tax=Waddlia chondrophila (strain ATCC VR-1470 / WSU 86-1044) TaxID=716544 RepID=D6YSU3_WADCW|nr:glycosyltransferase [Waddlia chondrophila]ADI39138.1 glycosyl transferase, group 2 family protein [Waddlia chondrophila WSU 86-1044]